MDQPLTPGQLVDVLRAERRRRWAAGDRILAEGFLHRHPELLADRQRVLELVYHEKLLRQEMGERPQLEEYTQRFPQLAAELRALFEVDSWMGKSEPEGGTPSNRLGADASGSATPPQQEDPATEEWPTIAGYEILERVGRGGMGIVYRARDECLNRIVALKVLRAGDAAEAAELRRFHAEAESQARLQHPHIVQVYEVGEANGCPYLALEYVDGGSLDQHLAGQPLPAAEAAQLVESLARAVDHAHRHGLIHRDLKPANILVAGGSETVDQEMASPAPTGPRPRFTLKITDFGLVKRLEGPAGPTTTSAVLGTPAYMAPEQAADRPQPIGPPADVYALGVILYEMLTGRVPFVAGSPYEVLVQKHTLDPVPPSRFQPSVPRALDILTLKCLQREPERRFPSAAELADELCRFLHHEPIRTRAAGRWERLALWCRRNPVRAALSAALGLAGVALVLLAIITYGQARKASQTSRRLQEIDALCNQLQDRLDEEKRRGGRSPLANPPYASQVRC